MFVTHAEAKKLKEQVSELDTLRPLLTLSRHPPRSGLLTLIKSGRARAGGGTYNFETNTYLIASRPPGDLRP